VQPEAILSAAWKPTPRESPHRIGLGTPASLH